MGVPVRPRRRRPTFSYAPSPVEDETLGSWVQRVAWGQETCGSRLVGPGDIDWSPPAEILSLLAERGEQSIETLGAMALSRRYPLATRRDFALAEGLVFPACHAFCPLCAGRDLDQFGHVILRARNAGLWRLTCEEHRCLLDSVEAEYEITPHRMITQRQWLDGRIRAGRPAFPAPPVALVFERAIERAGKACNPGPLWLERDPEQFLAAAAFLTNYVLMLRRAGGGRAPSPAWALLGGRMPGVFGEGVSVWDEGLLHRLPTWLRVRAMTACARLLLRPRAADRLGETYWWTPPGAQRDHFGSAWTAATGTLGRASLEMLWEAATAWSPPLRTEVRKVVAHRLAAIGAFRR